MGVQVTSAVLNVTIGDNLGPLGFLGLLLSLLCPVPPSTTIDNSEPEHPGFTGPIFTSKARVLPVWKSQSLYAFQEVFSQRGILVVELGLCGGGGEGGLHEGHEAHTHCSADSQAHWRRCVVQQIVQHIHHQGHQGFFLSPLALLKE